MSNEAIEKVISDYYTSLANMNPQGWLGTLADDAAIYDPVGKPPLNPQEDSQKFFTLLTTFYDKFEVNQEALFIVGNEAAVKWEMTVIAKNGREAIAQGITTFEINETGKITQIKAYWNEDKFKAQLIK